MLRGKKEHIFTHYNYVWYTLD